METELKHSQVNKDEVNRSRNAAKKSSKAQAHTHTHTHRTKSSLLGRHRMSRKPRIKAEDTKLRTESYGQG